MNFRIHYLIVTVIFFTSILYTHCHSDVTSEDGYKRALVLIESRKFDEAKKILDDLLGKYPENPYILHNLGLVSAGQSDLKGACEYWRRAIDADPHFETSYLNLGIALIQRGEVKEAEMVLKTAITVFPDNPHLHYNLAVSLGYQKRYDEAEAEYNKVLEIKPDHVQSLFNMALLYQKRNPTKAVNLWRRYLDIARGIPDEARYVREAEIYLQLAIANAESEKNKE